MTTNFNQVIDTLAKANQDLIDGKITVDQAKVIGINTQVIINAAKVTLDLMKFQDKKEAGFFRENGDPSLLDDTLKEIEKNRAKPLELGKPKAV